MINTKSSNHTSFTIIYKTYSSCSYKSRKKNHSRCLLRLGIHFFQCFSSCYLNNTLGSINAVFVSLSFRRWRMLISCKVYCWILMRLMLLLWNALMYCIYSAWRCSLEIRSGSSVLSVQWFMEKWLGINQKERWRGVLINGWNVRDILMSGQL